MHFIKKFNSFAAYLLFLCFKLRECHQTAAIDVSFVDFNVDDILNSDLTPAKIVTDQLGYFLEYENNNMENVTMHRPEWSCLNSTDLNTAVKSMRFHRHMMNEYLLSGYLSKEIMGSIPRSVNFSEAIEKRSGIPKNDSHADNINFSSLASNHKLLEDEGSSQYTTWLKRMNTFEDIQKQLLDKRKQHSHLKKKLPAVNRRQFSNVNLDPTYGDPADVNDDGADYLEDGDITGYAFTNDPTEQNVPVNFHKIHQKSMTDGQFGNLNKQAVSKVGYDNGYDDNAQPHSMHNYAPTAPAKQTKEISIKDITDIALTTLAFLSFGMFILQVLMCITMSKDDTNMVMLPMEGTDNGDIPGDGNTEEIRRKRRSILSKQMGNIEEIDHLAKRALFSLNAVTFMSKDGGSCHYYSLCENNKYARRLEDLKKLWIPAWSLGISWLTTKFSNSNKESLLPNESSIMNSLKAVIVGLNDGNCASHYVNKCKELFNNM